MNYFAGLCFFWAAIGIGSRIAMAVMGPRWREWELNSAYTADKPRWLYAVGAVGIALLVVTWALVFTTDVPHSWIIAVLVSLTGVKLYFILFDYDSFRAFVSRTLADSGKMMQLNVGVLVFSVALIAMGVWLY
jgi:hypothetical protein